MVRGLRGSVVGLIVWNGQSVEGSLEIRVSVRGMDVPGKSADVW